jgi:hypothetical protein
MNSPRFFEIMTEDRSSITIDLDKIIAVILPSILNSAQSVALIISASPMAINCKVSDGEKLIEAWKAYNKVMLIN